MAYEFDFYIYSSIDYMNLAKTFKMNNVSNKCQPIKSICSNGISSGDNVKLFCDPFSIQITNQCIIFLRFKNSREVYSGTLARSFRIIALKTSCRRRFTGGTRITFLRVPVTIKSQRIFRYTTQTTNSKNIFLIKSEPFLRDRGGGANQCSPSGL